jgi:hypothetical protein
MDVWAPEDPYREQQRCFPPRKVDRITYRRATESVQGQVVKLSRCCLRRALGWIWGNAGSTGWQPLDRLPPCTGRRTPPDV